MSRLSHLSPSFVLAALLAGGLFSSCSDELLDDPPQDKNSSSGDLGGTMTGSAPAGTDIPSGDSTDTSSKDPDATHVEQGGVWISKINASNRTKWIFLDLDDRVFPAADAAEAGAWDLAFQRVRVRVNGGTGGPGSVTGLMVPGAQSFDNMTVAPSTGFVPDTTPEQKDPDDIFDQEGKVFSFWYEYTPDGHVVTPKEQSYAVKTDKGAVFKVQILDYYNEAKTSAHYTIRWARLPDA